MDPGDPYAPPLFACKNCGGEMWPAEAWNEFDFCNDLEDWEKQAEAFYGRQDTSYEPFDAPNFQNLSTNKVGRNNPCPCGSGKKYKRCCGKK